MNTLTLESWCKPTGAERSTPMGQISFRVSDDYHLKMETLEEQLSKSGDTHQSDLSIDMNTLQLKTPDDCGALTDCKFHVYIGKQDHRGHFFLKGHRAQDNALVYTNAVMVDELG